MNLTNLERAIDGAFRATVDAYTKQCREEIETEQWAWDGVTLRRNGDRVGSPRDAVDTRDLIDSQQEPTYPRPTVARLEWTSDHSRLVYLGKFDQEIYPGRPWGKAAAEHLNIAKVMAEELRRRL